jgi:hypothetical protein
MPDKISSSDCFAVLHDEVAVRFLDGPRRREAAGGHRDGVFVRLRIDAVLAKNELLLSRQISLATRSSMRFDLWI